MARVILTEAGEDFLVGGADVDMIGTTAFGENIQVISGSISFDASFNQGGDAILLPGDASSYTVERTGSQIIIAGGGITISVPVGPAGIDIGFDNGVFELQVNTASGNAVIGDQVITNDPEPIHGAPPAPGTTPIIAEKSGQNDGVSTAQLIDRNSLKVAKNNLLDNDDLPSAAIDGSISSNIDEDFFKIILAEGEALILDVDGISNGLDTLLRIFGPDGVELLAGDDAPLDSGSLPHPSGGGGTQDSFMSFRAPESGTYSFSIGSWDGGTSGLYRLNVSIGPVVSLEEIIAEDVAAMMSDYKWDETSLSYSFPSNPNDYGPGSTDGEEDDNFEAFNGTQRFAVDQGLGYFASVSGLTFQAQTLNPGLADLRFAMSDLPETAYAAYPTGSANQGTSWYNNSSGDYDAPLPGNYAWATLLHETGHSFGLKHPQESPSVSIGRDSLETSVMSYRSYVGAPLGEDFGYTNESWGYPQTLMMYDIAALQAMYGANFSHQSGNTIYSWSTTTGRLSINGTGQLIPGANRVFMTVWDGNGNDTYDLSNYDSPVRIDLRPGEWTYTSAVQLANLGDGNTAKGNIANALLHDGDPRSLIENAIGGSGNDTITANAASNRLTGGGGSDTFRWFEVEDAAAGMTADTVTDFLTGSDKIDLSRIDAVFGSQADNAFTFIGTAQFSGTAGQLRYEQSGSAIRIEGDINGDQVADLHILLNGLSQTVATDFVL